MSSRTYSSQTNTQTHAKTGAKTSTNTSANPSPSSRAAASTQGTANDLAAADPIPIDGFRQIVEMLRIADPSFRESLLRRLAAKDANLARSLRQDLQDREN
jgi:hypothetical protein